jgi:hypothetical protein
MRSQYNVWAYWLLLESVWASHIPKWAAVHDGVRSARSRTARVVVGSSNARSGKVDLMAHRPGIYGRADAADVLDPLGRSLFADEKRQPRYAVRQGSRTREESVS